MKILLVTGLYPPAIGGPATYVSAVAKALSERGHVVSVITYSSAKIKKDGKIHIYAIKRNLPAPIRWVLLMWRLRRLMPQHDVVFVNGLPIQVAVLHKPGRGRLVAKVVGDGAWEQARLRRLTYEGIDAFQTGEVPRKIRRFHRMERSAIAKADAVITPSQYLKTIVSGWGVLPEKIKVVLNAPHGIETISKKEEARAELKLSGRVLVTAGRLVPWKGMEQLIEAMKQIPAPAVLYIIGDGPDRPLLEAKIREHRLTQRVRLMGKQPREVLLKYMAAADVFILNSEYEGLPHVLLEAFACGTPVIATDVCGTPEALRDGIDGILVPLGDERSLVDAIQIVTTQPEIQAKFSKASRERLKDFSWDRLIEETVAVLEGRTS